MQFTVLFWNILLDNQKHGVRNAQKLLSELRVILQTYKPDCIGLNEVLQHKEHMAPLVFQVLAEENYQHRYFAPSSPVDENWVVGTAVASRHPLHDASDIVLGHDIYAETEGFPGHKLKAVATRIRLPNEQVLHFIAAHPVHLRARFLKPHYQHTRALTEFLRGAGLNDEAVVIGGDFNEPRFMPGSFYQANKDWLHHRTGTLLNPTWRYLTARKNPIRANLDKLFWAKNSALQLLNFRVLPIDVSDHRPIIATFVYRPNA